LAGKKALEFGLKPVALYDVGYQGGFDKECQDYSQARSAVSGCAEVGGHKGHAQHYINGKDRGQQKSNSRAEVAFLVGHKNILQRTFNSALFQRVASDAATRAEGPSRRVSQIPVGNST
jgi:hypothetical protein